MRRTERESYVGEVMSKGQSWSDKQGGGEWIFPYKFSPKDLEMTGKFGNFAVRNNKMKKMRKDSELRGSFLAIRAERLSSVMARLRGWLAALVLTVVASAGAMGQELQVVSFEETMEVMYSDKQVRDLNNEVCALVRVELPVKGAVFDGGIVSQSFRVNQYYVYMPQGEKLLRILCPGCQTLDVDMSSILGSGLKRSRIYKLVLSGYPTSAEEIEGSNPDMTLSEVTDLCMQASQLLNNTEYFKALEIFFKAAEYTGKDVDNNVRKTTLSQIFDNIGACYGRMGDTQNCIEYENKAINYDYTNLQARRNLIASYYLTGQYDAAMNNINSYIQYFLEGDNAVTTNITYIDGGRSNNFVVYYYKGEIHRMRGEYKQAEESYLKSLAYMDDDYSSYFGLADVYLATNRYVEAIEYYEKGIEYEPYKYPTIERYKSLAEAYLKNDQTEKAIETWERCEKCIDFVENTISNMSQSPQDEEAVAYMMNNVMELNYHRNLCELWICRYSEPSYEINKRYYDVIEILSIGENIILPLDYLRLGFNYFTLKDIEGTIEIIRKGMEKFPDDVDIMYAYTLQLDNDAPEKITLLKQILEKKNSVNPLLVNYDGVYNALAWTYCCRGEYSTGLPYAEKAVAMNAEDDDSWETIGEIYYGLGRYDDCIEAMTRCLAIEDCDNQKSALTFRGKAYMAIGETKKGNNDLEKAKKYEE